MFKVSDCKIIHGLTAKKSADDEKTVPSLIDYAVEEIKQKLLQTDINTLTPIEAMSMLYEMKRAVGG